MADVQSFPPLSDPRARVLVLGTMPGAASLSATQYYAHPRNVFWDIIETLFDIPRTLEYPSRCAALTARGIAVWDVLARCHRPGSLDANIDPTTVVVNDFSAFFANHASIERLCFNGAMAETLFKRHARHMLPNSAIERLRLPSTSPANASMSVDDKTKRWRIALVG